MAVQLPVFQTQSADFEYTIELDNINTLVRLTYNVRSGFWKMNLSVNGNTLYNIKLVKNFPLLKQNKALFPYLPGDFFVLKISDESEEDFNYDNFGTVWGLVYVTAAEYEAWREANGL